MKEMRRLKFSSSSSEAEGDDESEFQDKSNVKPKRERNDDLEASSSSKKKKKGPKVDLEELLARTYPKDISRGAQSEGELRRSKRNKKKAAKTFKSSDFVKKWTGDEEIGVAMALLDSSSPEGGLNISEFYKRGKEVLNYEVSKCQLYDKMRSMKRRFMFITSMMEQGLVPEHRIEFRTPQEPALFKMWQQIWGQNISNNNAENPEAGNLNIRVNDAENDIRNPSPRAMEAGNPDAILTGAENTKAGVNGAANPKPGVIEFENPNAKPRVREARNQNSSSSAAENPRNHKSIVIEIGNPRPTVSQAANSNSLVNEALNPFSWASGAERSKNLNPGVIEDPDPKEINVGNPNPRFIVAENPDPNGSRAEECNGDTSADHVRGHAIDKGGVTRPRSEINHTCGFATLQASSGFGSEIVYEECMDSTSFLSKTMKKLVNAANNVKYIPHPELHQKYRQHYINQMKLLSETLGLLQEECNLWLNVMEAPNRPPNP